MRTLLGLVAILWVAIPARAQSCPPHGSQGLDLAPDMSVLHGTVIYHDELRKWMGLKLDQPACGEKEVQLVFPDSGAWRRAESLRECSVTVSGELFYSPTGYYSAKIAISPATLKLDASCHPFPVQPDISAISIPPDLRTYDASITVDYRGKGHVEVEVWRHRDPRASLKPWQAYVDYFLNGGADVVYFGCREGFGLEDITQIPKSSSGIQREPPNRAGANLQDSVARNTITFTCQMMPPADDAKGKPPKAAPK